MPDEADVRVVRAWLVLSELGRVDDRLREVVAGLESEVRDVVGWIGRVPSSDDLGRDALVAVVTGLWVARCGRPDPMPVERATEVLRHACAALGIDEPEAA